MDRSFAGMAMRYALPEQRRHEARSPRNANGVKAIAATRGTL
jgi:hypothetical protein